MRRAIVTAGCAAALLTAVAPAGALTIYAHRGGAIVNGKAVYPENTLPAFRRSAKLGFALEMDVHLTKDRVPIVIHDGSLDRTTTCAGAVNARTWANIRKHCRADYLGLAADTSGVPHRRARRPVALSTLARVLAVAKGAHVATDIEINDYPTWPDWDPTTAYAVTEVKAIRAAGLPRSSVIVQSFFTSWLDAAAQQWPAVPTAVLSFQAQNAQARDIAVGKYAWDSPEWPLDSAYVAQAHADGLKVVPFTIDKAGEIVAARAVGVDAVITNDPVLARRALAK
jgi:glycerophosphoryl diester phosphodiesterase